MVRWTREEEEKLLEMYQTGHNYQEIAGALSRSEGSITTKLHRLKAKETKEPIYRGERGAPTEEQPEAEQIYDELILALLDEFRKIRETLPNLGKKHITISLGIFC